MEEFDLIVIGSGPGGYVAAIRAAQLGMKVCCIEKDKTLGGTCLNVGCIPSKALLHSSEYYQKLLKEGKQHGIECESLTLNFEQMMQRKEKVVDSLVNGVAFLFKKNKVVRIEGSARLISPNSVEVAGKELKAKNILLATGSEAIPLPFLPFDEKIVLSSTGALVLPSIPKTLLMVGAGVIGLELGSVYQRLGAKVIVIELMDRVCPTLDREISKGLLTIFKKQGMEIHLSSKVKEGKVEKKKVTLTVETPEGEQKFAADVVLVAIGRHAYSQDLGLENVGIERDKQGRVQVDDQFRTSVPNIYAIGDLIDGPMLAHKASEEGIAVVERLAGYPSKVNYLAIPNVMYTWPEVACVGMTEEEAKAAGLEIRKGVFPFRAVARARCSGDEDGFVKVIGEADTDRVIGMHIIGPNASEMIGEGVIAIEKKMTLKELGQASHAHPTNSEGIKEAALAAHGHAIHF